MYFVIVIRRCLSGPHPGHDVFCICSLVSKSCICYSEKRPTPWNLCLYCNHLQSCPWHWSWMDGGSRGDLGQVRPHHVHVVRDQQGHLQDPRLRRWEEQTFSGRKTSTAGWAENCKCQYSLANCKYFVFKFQLSKLLDHLDDLKHLETTSMKSSWQPPKVTIDW